MKQSNSRSDSDDEKQTYLSWGLKGITILESLLLAMALYYLGFGGDDVWGWLKLGLYAVSAFLVSYLVYRLAIEKGATGPLASVIVGFFSLLLVGVTFFIATAAGLSFEQTRVFRMSDYIENTSVYSDLRTQQSSKTSELAPIVSGIADDLKAKAECETQSSCVSGRGTGGYGTVSRTLENLSLRANSLVGQIKEGQSARADIQNQIGSVITRMNETLSNGEVSLDVRRGHLRQQDTDLRQLLNALDEAVPLALISSYAQELRLGVSINDRPDVTQTINRFLNGYAGTIEAAVAGIERQEIIRKSFPTPTGALDTFQYAHKFAPAMLLAFVIDLVFPIALFIYTLNAIREVTPQPPKASRKRTEFEALTELRTLDVDELAEASAKRHYRRGPSRPKNRS